MRVDAGAADDDVDAPPGVAGALDQALEVGLAPDVAGEAEHLQPLVGQLPLRGIHPARIAARDDDAGAVAGERPRDGQADPLGRAGDDGGPAGEVEGRGAALRRLRSM